MLNGDGAGPINHLCVPSGVCARYAPEGRSLVSVSVVGNPSETDQTLEALVSIQLHRWFRSTEGWRHLRTYRIPFALPAQPSGWLSPVSKPVRISEGIVACGDYLDVASTNGAMLPGRRAAESIAP